MFGLHNLKPTPGSRKKKKRVGRGNASGSGNYSGRGMKGQNSRTGKKLRASFEGGQTPMFRRMPKLRGFTNPNYLEYQVINIEKIARHFKSGDKVDPMSLFEKGLVGKINEPVKLLGDGEIDFAVEVMVEAASASAIKKIEKAGGKVTLPVVSE
jgi:large subunit ribosomal protein L15